MLSLVNDVLDLSKVEASHLELDLQPIRLADVLDDAIASTHLAAAQGNRLRVSETDAMAVDAPRLLSSERLHPTSLRRTVHRTGTDVAAFGGNGRWPHCHKYRAQRQRLHPRGTTRALMNDSEKHALPFHGLLYHCVVTSARRRLTTHVHDLANARYV